MSLSDIEQVRRNIKVLELMDRSWRAHGDGNHDESNRLVREACELDVQAVSVIQGGMVIGEVPRPDSDPAAWDAYVDAQRAKLAQLETQAAREQVPT